MKKFFEVFSELNVYDKLRKQVENLIVKSVEFSVSSDNNDGLDEIHVDP